MKIAVYTICKNEIKYIRRFLKNTESADSVVLLDTGSTDGTYEYLKKRASKDSRILLDQKIYSNFRFDVARNDSLKLVPKDVNLCVRIDIDEYLSKGWREELEKNFNPSISSYNFNYVEKIHHHITRNTRCNNAHIPGPDWGWHYPVHENLINTHSFKTLDIPTITVTHTPKTGTSNKEKIYFYRNLLSLRYEESPGDIMTLYYRLYDELQKEHSNLEKIRDLSAILLSRDEALNQDIISNLLRCCVFRCLNKLTHFQLNALKDILRIMGFQHIDLRNRRKLRRDFKLLKNCEGLEYLCINEYIKPLPLKKKKDDFHALREAYERIQLYLNSQLENIQSLLNENNDPFLVARQKLLKEAISKNRELSLLIRSLETTTPLKKLALEVMVVDHCNLNCAGCNHFAPLADPSYYSIEQYEKDLKKLKKLYKGKIWDVKLMGGEPLLHPDLVSFMKVTRRVLPFAQVSILTNGLLLPKQIKEFWESFNKYRVKLSVTDYKDTPLEEISNLAEFYQVPFEVYPDYENEGLEKKLFSKFCVNLWGDTDVNPKFLDCGNANKTLTLRQGILYTCPFKATFPFFKKKFNVDIPDFENGIDIYKVKSGDEISEFLCHPTELCKYCLGECRLIPWSRSTQSISEWLPDRECVPRYKKNEIVNKVIEYDKE